MKFRSPLFRVEAVLEAPGWVLLLGCVLVTLAVIATTMEAF